MKISNKKATFNYEIIESFEAGIILTGSEVKSIKEGRANLTDHDYWLDYHWLYA